MNSDSVVKILGSDIELGNSILGLDGTRKTGREAARVLLREMPGVMSFQSQSQTPPPADDRPGTYGRAADGTRWDPQDWGRKFTAAGACAYIDSDHLEVTTAECRSAFDQVAARHAALVIARQAMLTANARLPEGQSLQVFVNNSDGYGSSYGSHLSFFLTRHAYEEIFYRRVQKLLFLATHMISSVVLTGAGKVGSENGREDVDFQLSARADFMEVLTSPATMWHRPVVNSRDEALCGPSRWVVRGGSGDLDRRFARLHVIFFDSTLCHASSLLAAGTTQLVLAMIEQDEIDLDLLLESPLDAVLAFSHDPGLRADARLLSGGRYTAVDIQEALLDRVCRFVATGRAEGIVPRAQEIVALWAETLDLLRAGDLDALSRRLDWALKYRILDAARDRHDLAWDSPRLKALDRMYSSLDADEGLYWAYEASGHVERLVSPGAIERRVHEPPDDTRAWLRGRLLGMAEPGQILGVDWDHIRTRRGTILLADPREGTREEYESVLTPGLTLDDLLDDLAVAEATAIGSTSTPIRSDDALPAPWPAAPVREITNTQEDEGRGGDDVRT